VRRSGVTLVELLVVMTILGLVFGVTGLAIVSLRAPRESKVILAMRAARVEAIRSGKPVRLSFDSPTVLFLPDGRAIGLGLDPLTGAPLAAR